MDVRYGRVEWGVNGSRAITKTWSQPLRWNREAKKAGEHRKVFCASLADVFEDWSGSIIDSVGMKIFVGPDGERCATGLDIEHGGAIQLKPTWRPLAMVDLRVDLFHLIDKCDACYFLLLTKRPENIRRMWQGPNRSNVWLGTSVANQKNVEEYIPRLLSCRGLGPVLFLSVEPQIGRIDLSRFLFPTPTVDWVIIGGESKQGNREPRQFDMDWARLLIRQCKEANVPCFVKQLGSHVTDRGHRVHLNDSSHGDDMSEWPEELRIRQCPETFYDPLVLTAV